jgi:hypothetical protein
MALSRERLCGNTAGGLSSGDPFARHIAEGNCVRIPLGGLLQLDLVVHDYAADGFAGLFGFILEAVKPLRRMISLQRTKTLGSAISPPRACQQHGSKAYADYGFRVSALEALALRQERPPRQPKLLYRPNLAMLRLVGRAA